MYTIVYFSYYSNCGAALRLEGHFQDLIIVLYNKPYTEEDFVLLFQRGIEAGFNYFFQQFHAPLCYFATRLVNDQQAAEDIVEESFIKLWDRHARFSNIKAIKSFLYITTKNSCLNYLKRFKIILKDQTAFREFGETVEEDILNEMIRTEVLMEINKAIEKLPPKCGEICRLS
ncbi:MAG TPA: sigma-70 family RNA polymerase sigma factor, partial [Chitinophagaceae bacterium]|nr:sigma-70 family RNA polymerase sigma factor [Chitinophagaceae bacterium]